MPTSLAGYTVIRNISGKSKFFAFVGPNGAYLADDEDVKIRGSIWDLWAKDKVMTDALQAALDDDQIVIMQTPITICYDDTLNVVKAVGIDNSVVVDVDPDYGSYSGDGPDV